MVKIGIDTDEKEQGTLSMGIHTVNLMGVQNYFLPEKGTVTKGSKGNYTKEKF